MTVSKIASQIYQTAKAAAEGVWNWRLEWSKAMKQAWREVMSTLLTEEAKKAMAKLAEIDPAAAKEIAAQYPTDAKATKGTQGELEDMEGKPEETSIYRKEETDTEVIILDAASGREKVSFDKGEKARITGSSCLPTDIKEANELARLIASVTEQLFSE